MSGSIIEIAVKLIPIFFRSATHKVWALYPWRVNQCISLDLNSPSISKELRNSLDLVSSSGSYGIYVKKKINRIKKLRKQFSNVFRSFIGSAGPKWISFNVEPIIDKSWIELLTKRPSTILFFSELFFSARRTRLSPERNGIILKMNTIVSFYGENLWPIQKENHQEMVHGIRWTIRRFAWNISNHSIVNLFIAHLLSTRLNVCPYC